MDICEEKKRVDTSGWKWMIMDETKLKWMKVAASGKKLRKEDKGGYKWIMVNTKVGLTKQERMKVDECWWKWIKVD